ncbi:hypothetical protein [Geodermatophilus normandii]|uniref:Uncharacterized protein n=1 Tax=Geodermatophilus normandii TaxID=1137989 RepID=A0A6P0GH47_9ACTN|nr:hypothetical protein [Geodermatophilus normandii]NEM06570.1 hypothetical protein [Geodermatophilus normandii]
MPGSRTRRTTAGRLARGTVRIARPALLAVAVPVAALGAVALPLGRAVVLVPLMAAVAAALVAAGHDGFPGRPGARRTVALAAAWGALAVPFASGVHLTGPVGAAAVAIVLVLGLVVAADATSRALTRSARDVAAQLAVESSLRELWEQWQWTGEALRPGADPAGRATALVLRDVLLDELARRDPAGFDRWMREGAGDPPDHWYEQDAPR